MMSGIIRSVSIRERRLMPTKKRGPLKGRKVYVLIDLYIGDIASWGGSL